MKVCVSVCVFMYVYEHTPLYLSHCIDFPFAFSTLSSLNWGYIIEDIKIRPTTVFASIARLITNEIILLILVVLRTRTVLLEPAFRLFDIGISSYMFL